VQHLLSIYGYPTPAIVFQLDFGQIGVAVFCAISGYLAFGPSRERPLKWLWRRMQRIYVPFWMVVPCLFMANAMASYKTTSWRVFAAEMTGFGYFIYPRQLVGIHLWFISLILLCYLAAAMVRAEWRSGPLVCLLAIAGLYTSGAHVFG